MAGEKMMPMEHVGIGFLAALVISVIFPGLGITGLFLVFLASIFIDVDHYFAYVKAKKDWSLKRAYAWFMNDDGTTKSFVEKAFIPFHSIEFLALLIGMLYIINNYVLPVWMFHVVFSILLGCTIHLVVDLIYILYTHDKLYIKVSFIYSYFKNMSLLKNEHIKRYNQIISNWK
jgi:hypothetical protein